MIMIDDRWMIYIYIEYGSMRIVVIDLEIVLNDRSIVVHEKYILVMA